MEVRNLPGVEEGTFLVRHQVRPRDIGLDGVLRLALCSFLALLGLQVRVRGFRVRVQV